MRKHFAFPFLFPLLLAVLVVAPGCSPSEDEPPAAPAPTAHDPLAESIARLVEQLQADPSEEGPVAALISLQGAGLPGARLLLADEDADVRLAGVSVATEILLPESLDVLVAQLDDPDENVRLGVVEALGQWRNTRATPALLARYPGEDDDQVRYEILTTLGRIGSPEAEPILRAGLTDEDRYVRMWAMDALCEMDTPDARERAIEMLRDPEKYVRQQVMLSCKRELDHPSAAATVVEVSLAADNFEEAMRGRAILQNMLRSENRDLNKATLLKIAIPALETDRRTRAAILLAEIDEPRALPALIDGASDPNLMVRHNIAYQLGRYGDASAVPALITLLGDDTEIVSATAYDALLLFADQNNEQAKEATQNYDGKKFMGRLRDYERKAGR